MTEQEDRFLTHWWVENLEQLDREIGRLAVLCQVKILDTGVITRVLKNDDAVCGAHNPAAFAKLRNLLMLHFAIHQKSADMLGQAQTLGIEDYIIGRLKKIFPDSLGTWPPA